MCIALGRELSIFFNNIESKTTQVRSSCCTILGSPAEASAENPAGLFYLLRIVMD